jgi:hypothetical protein
LKAQVTKRLEASGVTTECLDSFMTEKSEEIETLIRHPEQLATEYKEFCAQYLSDQKRESELNEQQAAVQAKLEAAKLTAMKLYQSGGLHYLYLSGLSDFASTHKDFALPNYLQGFGVSYSLGASKPIFKTCISLSAFYESGETTINDGSHIIGNNPNTALTNLAFPIDAEIVIGKQVLDTGETMSEDWFKLFYLKLGAGYSFNTLTYPTKQTASGPYAQPGDVNVTMVDYSWNSYSYTAAIGFGFIEARYRGFIPQNNDSQMSKLSAITLGINIPWSLYN